VVEVCHESSVEPGCSVVTLSQRVAPRAFYALTRTKSSELVDASYGSENRVVSKNNRFTIDLSLRALLMWRSF